MYRVSSHKLWLRIFKFITSLLLAEITLGPIKDLLLAYPQVSTLLMVFSALQCTHE